MKPSQHADGASEHMREEHTTHRAPRARRTAPTEHVNEMRAVETRAQKSRVDDSQVRTWSRRDGLIVPQEIAREFVRVGHADYHLQDGRHGFTNHGDRFSTTLSTPQFVAKLVSAMESNGVQTIDVSGSSDQFRQRAWRAAVSSGLSVKGYTPTAFEKAKFLRSPSAAENSPARPVVVDDQPAPRHAQSSIPTGTLAVGHLVEHGRGQEPNGRASYYVRLETKAGERTLWSPDLERAFEASRTKPQIGNTIGVRALARDQLLFNPDDTPAPTHKRGAADEPFFVVEKSQFFAMRAAAATTFRDHDIPSDTGVARYPELAGAYTLLKVAVRSLERDVPNRADRFRYLISMRHEMAAHIARGEPVPTLEGLDRLLRTPSVAAEAAKIREPLVRS